MRVGKRQFTVYVENNFCFLFCLFVFNKSQIASDFPARECYKNVHEAAPDDGNGAVEPSMSHTKTVVTRTLKRRLVCRRCHSDVQPTVLPQERECVAMAEVCRGV